MHLDGDGVPAKGMLWRLNADGSLQNKATGMLLGTEGGRVDRKVPVVCDVRLARGPGDPDLQAWTLTSHREVRGR